MSIDSYATYLNSMNQRSDVSFDLIASHTFDAIVEVLSGRNLRCAQLVIILESFPVNPRHVEGRNSPIEQSALRKNASFKSVSKYHSVRGKLGVNRGDVSEDIVTHHYEVYSQFSTYKIELIIAMFCQIVDPINFELVMSKLNAKERGMLLFRVGILNIWNPLKPDGAYSLNISHRGDRQVLKVLLMLSCIEPGQNWVDETFRESHDIAVAAVGDWNVPLAWYADVNIPPHGIVNLKYCSPTFENKPNVAARMALMSLVHAEAYEIDSHKFHRRSLTGAMNLNVEHGCSLGFDDTIFTLANPLLEDGVHRASILAAPSPALREDMN